MDSLLILPFVVTVLLLNQIGMVPYISSWILISFGDRKIQHFDFHEVLSLFSKLRKQSIDFQIIG